jgi:hypothetical protein
MQQAGGLHVWRRSSVSASRPGGSMREARGTEVLRVHPARQKFPHAGIRGIGQHLV